MGACVHVCMHVGTCGCILTEHVSGPSGNNMSSVGVHALVKLLLINTTIRYKVLHGGGEEEEEGGSYLYPSAERLRGTTTTFLRRTCRKLQLPWNSMS